MWKDFFYFTKVQQGGVVVLVVLILVVVILNFTMPLFVPDTEGVDVDAYTEELQEFKASLISRDSLKKEEQKRIQEKRKSKYASTEKKEQEPYTLFSFDPNRVDSVTFIQLGLSPRVASNILKYRFKGGRFKTSDDFRKIYGLSDSKFSELKPYINIARSAAIVETMGVNQPVGDSLVLEETSDSLFVVDLNSADTVELMKVKGIGSYYAREIVGFRKQSGGFVSVEQLLELKHMRPENYDRIKPYCIADTTKVKKIEVNRASVDFLKRHPYINFYQAKVIYELRRAKGRLKGMDDLRRFDEFSDDDIRRLAPYLSFE